MCVCRCVGAPLGSSLSKSQVMSLVWLGALSWAPSSYFNRCLSRVWLWRLWSGGNAMAFDFCLKKSSVSDLWGHWDHLSRLKITSGKPRIGESKRGLTLAGALRWNRDSYRAGHWPWTTENFFFFSIFLNPKAWYHLADRFFSWSNWTTSLLCQWYKVLQQDYHLNKNNKQVK